MDIATRATLVKESVKIRRIETADVAQKVKIHWAIKGDENLEYFHGIFNKKIR